MQDLDLYRRLAASRESTGGETRTLVWGDQALEINGIARDLARDLDRRWGDFLARPVPSTPPMRLNLRDGGPGEWLISAAGPELYRLESFNEGEMRLVASHNYALSRDPNPGEWRLAVRNDSPEPFQRIVDNAARYLIAQRTVELGGFAMHSSAVLRDGRAFVFAGPSGSGKTTAVRLAGPAQSLGDDFGLVIPGADGWLAPALPFDNSERIEGAPAHGLHPVAGIWRLHQAPEDRVEKPHPALAEASLMSCVAFPWAMPEVGGELLEHVGGFVGTGGFRHLHFTRNSAIWTHLL